MEWISAHLTGKGNYQMTLYRILHENLTGEDETTQQHAYHHSCLITQPNDLMTQPYYFHIITLDMTGHLNKSNQWVCSSLRIMLGKIGDRYQSYCTTYKPHAMTTHHRGAGHKGKDRDLDFPCRRYWKQR